MLDETNKRRTLHGVPDLAYDNKLAKEALAWCKKLAKDDEFEHSKYDESTGRERWGTFSFRVAKNQLIYRFNIQIRGQKR